MVSSNIGMLLTSGITATTPACVEHITSRGPSLGAEEVAADGGFGHYVDEIEWLKIIIIW